MNMWMDDAFFWFKRSRIAIPGVRGEHLLMHVTDTHIDAVDELSTDEEREKYRQQTELWNKFRGKFAAANGEPCGEAQDIPTFEAFEKQMALAQELQPEALLLSGDNLDHMHPAGERFLARQLAAYDGKYLCVPGNHEAEECAGAWERGVRTLDFEGFRVAAVDDSRMTVSDEDLDALRALCAEGTPIVLLCHVPILTDFCRAALVGSKYFFIDSETAEGNARAFLDLCAESDAVRAILCGHVHGYHAVEFAPGKPQIIGSQGMAGAVDLVRVVGE